MTTENNIFKQAREIISLPLVESFFPDTKAYIYKNEYFCRNPLRNDKNPGSFSINFVKGLYKELAKGHNDSGDFIDLVSKARGVSSLE